MSVTHPTREPSVMTSTEPTDDAQEAPAAPAPLLDMLDLDSVSDEAEPDVTVERGAHVVTGIDADGVGDGSGVDLEVLCRFAADVLAGENASPGQLDLHLVDRETMEELNRTHMNSDGPTDVLAFPLDPDEHDPVGADDRPMLLGDVVICPSVAFEQAPGHAGSFEAELALLAIHGTLHVLGHDHGETAERLAMQARERHHLERVDLAHPVPAP